MSDSNEGSLLDSIIASVIIFYFLMAMIILFPLLPGGVIGYEWSKELTTNSDIHKLSIIIGMVINFFVYKAVLRMFDMDIDKLKTKVYIYLFTIGFVMFLDTRIDNFMLHQVNKMIVETIKFFLDFDRWFVDNTFLNMGLIAIYAFMSFLILGFIIDIFKPKRKHKNKYIKSI
ncbi:hypothetical protein SMGD1_0272 [Sulfurimonas gotlandica GD1]|uniref:Uncharacterized protein n=1 Tax=Sulfurimonas gotlandica (strain DSM 19862 / JCM 16533 / GD1) TaxID=929558 RepID=B6BL61_SULGG|nr:hypothetical protein [Sulfurimonas gotlandica]EDZ62181.1 hypothetical protein CBGD1_2763 [Sulfurimonas gotlandica GD1]EHP28799.1 hypothetical protein SMGD1_0272 [Sulfurimonas gotlandica GD1]